MEVDKLPDAFVITTTNIHVRPGVLRLKVWFLLGRLLGIRPTTKFQIDALH